MRSSTTRKVEFKKKQMRFVGLMLILFVAFFVAIFSFAGSAEEFKNVWVFYGFLSIFVWVGIALLGAFRRVVVDGTNRTASTQWGVFLPFSTKHYDLGDAKVVSISQEMRTSGSGRNRGSYIVYPVRLEGVRNTKFNSNIKLKDGLDNLTLTALRDSVLARHDAERAAKLLALAVEDRTGETVSRREHDELDLSLVQRYRRDNVGVPSPPHHRTNSRIEVVSHGGTKKELRLPVRRRYLLSLFPSAFFLVWVYYFFNIPFDISFDMVNEILGPYLGNHAQWKLLAALVCVALAWSLRRDVVTVDREVVELDTRLLLLSWKVRGTRRFLVSDLEEMNLDKRALILLSDVAQVQINTANLDSNDAQFLHDSILYAIAR